MEIAWTLRTTLEVDSLLPQIMEKVTALMRADRSTFYVVDAARGELWSKVLQAVGQLPREIRLRVGDGIAGWVAQTGQIVNLADAYDDARFDRTWDIKTGYRTQSLLCVPIYDREQRVIAVIQCLNKVDRRRFDAEDEELLRCIGGQCAIALESAFLYQSLLDRNVALQEADARQRRAHAELEMLYDLEQQMSESGDVPALIRGALDRVCSLLGMRAASVMLVGEAGASVLAVTREGAALAVPAPDAREAKRLLQQARVPTHREVGSEGETLVGGALGSAPRELFVAPLSDGRAHFGLLELADCDGHADHAWVLRMASLVASQLARGIVVRRDREEGERAERLSLLGHSVGAILHDLRTPMTAIGGFAELMATEQDPEQRADFSGRIGRALEHMETMTHEVLSFARGRREVLVQKVYMHQFIEAVREMLVPETQRFGVQLIVNAEYDGIARFDESKIKRVIFNLARNACQAMGQSGTFTWNVRREDSSLVLECCDTGPGIPKEMEGRLFESFATHGKSDGTGLGLAMAKKIVDAHGGAISCTSTPGHGATFRIALPIS
jgi:signal transduction histidine kinase/putative methionine-R-sulfoxide reductase with GAF domain